MGGGEMGVVLLKAAGMKGDEEKRESGCKD